MWGRPEERLERATGAVLRKRGKAALEIVGTGFLISPDGHVITAGHVVAKFNKTDKMSFRDNEGNVADLRVIEHAFDQVTGNDFALCKIERVGQPWIGLALATGPRGEAFSRGYGGILVDAAPATGTLIGSLDVNGLARNRLFLFVSKEAGDPGYSGGAVYSEEAGGVVAVVTEAPKFQAGPHADTVLSYPLYHLRSLLRAKVHFLTRLRWWCLSLLGATAARPRRFAAIIAIVLMQLGLIGFGVYGLSAFSTNSRLAEFDRAEFLTLFSQESAFWTGPVGSTFWQEVKDKKRDFYADLDGLIRNNGMADTVVKLDSYYESITRCVIDDLCMEGPVCSAVYNRVWDFYSQYHPFLQTHYASLGRNTAPDIRAFLRTKCTPQRTIRCEKIDNFGELCATRPIEQ